jgi:hypothetical protein
MSRAPPSSRRRPFISFFNRQAHLNFANRLLIKLGQQSAFFVKSTYVSFDSVIPLFPSLIELILILLTNC